MGFCTVTAGFVSHLPSSMALSGRPVHTCVPPMGTWPRVLLSSGVLGC